MEITYRTLTPQQYGQRLRAVIAESESLHSHVQDIGDGKATIGWGLTLNRNDNVAIWRESGVRLSESDWKLLARIDKASAGVKTSLGLGFSKRIDEKEADLLLTASLGDYEGPAKRLGMPLSEERVALVSVTYNRGPGKILGHPLMDAIREGDRAEAWYQLRYECWGTERSAEAGLRKRRFAEAEIFGLYDDPAHVSRAEAGRVYDMYKKHLPEIERVERRFGMTVGGVEAQHNRIKQANRDYPGVVEQYGEVQTIASSLGPARATLLQELRRAHPERADEFTEKAFNAGQIDQALLRRVPPAGRDLSLDETEIRNHELRQKLREQVRSLDHQAGKSWDDTSERLAASALLMARENGFNARDDLQLAFNRPTERHAGGEILHLARLGASASPDPAANRAHMPTADALAVPVDERLRQVEAASQQQAQLQTERSQQVAEREMQTRGVPVMQI